METTEAIRALAALAHDSRLRIFRTLVQADGRTVSRRELAHAAPEQLDEHVPAELGPVPELEHPDRGHVPARTEVSPTLRASTGCTT